MLYIAHGDEVIVAFRTMTKCPLWYGVLPGGACGMFDPTHTKPYTPPEVSAAYNSLHSVVYCLHLFRLCVNFLFSVDHPTILSFIGVCYTFFIARRLLYSYIKNIAKVNQSSSVENVMSCVIITLIIHGYIMGAAIRSS